MEQKTTELTLALIRSVIRDEPLSDSFKENLSEEKLNSALRFSSSHDLGQLVAWGIKENNLTCATVETYILKAVYRYQQIKYEYDKLCSALEDACIPFMPLKGSVIRKYYKQPWMRTSCDIDILIHRSDLDTVRKMLVEELKYKPHLVDSHDESFYSPSDVHVEMHFDLIEEGTVKATDEILKNVWELSTVKEGRLYWHEMSDELFYLYHIAHMAKHVLNGGCGIKPFIDLWILDNIDGADAEKRNALLEEGEILKFTEMARRLSEIWFGTSKHDAVTVELEHYVLRGGVYGSTENRMSILRHKMGGRTRYVFSLIFLPYDAIKCMYPILRKHPVLTPVMQVHRWFRILFRGRIGKAKKTLMQNNSISDKQVNDVHRFLGDIGLV